MLKIRVLAALVFAPALLGLILLGGEALAYTCFVVAMLLAWEYQRLVFSPQDKILKVTLMLAVAVLAADHLGWLAHGQVVVMMPCLVLVPLICVLHKPDPIAQSMQRAGLWSLGVYWCGGLLPYLYALRLRPEDGLCLALMGLFCCWASDTGAYFAGRFFGKRPLYPAISPKKTLEGGIGGLICSALMAMALRWVLDAPIAYNHAAVLGILGAMAGVVGDLCESLLKRSVGAKDSSQLIPGHGGVFDRFDGVVFCVPVVYIYVMLFVGTPRAL